MCDKILFVHGALAHPTTIIRAIPVLVEQGCDVFCTALPGYGIVKEPDYLWYLGSEECEQWLEFYGEWIKHLYVWKVYSIGSHDFMYNSKYDINVKNSLLICGNICRRHHATYTTKSCVLLQCRSMYLGAGRTNGPNVTQAYEETVGLGP